MLIDVNKGIPTIKQYHVAFLYVERKQNSFFTQPFLSPLLSIAVNLMVDCCSASPRSSTPKFPFLDDLSMHICLIYVFAFAVIEASKSTLMELNYTS